MTVDWSPFQIRGGPLPVTGATAGDGEPCLLLAHPPFSARHCAQPLLDALAQRCLTVAIDSPTGSDVVVNSMSIAMAMHQTCNELQMRPRLVLGIGLGCAAVADFAITRPQWVGRVVLIDPLLPGFHKVLPPAERRLIGRSKGLWLHLRRQRLLAELCGPLAPQPLQEILAAPERLAAYQRLLQALQPPTTAHELRARVLHYCHLQAACLLVCGVRSPNSPAAALSMILRRMTDARILAVPQAGRFPHLERPQLVLPAVMKFLAGDWPVEPGLPEPQDSGGP
jgi:pimeloyl-ACP methyl ester carboxylesterase